MSRRLKIYALITGAIVVLLTSLGAVFVLGLGAGHREIPRTGEKELAVNLQAAFGKVYISRGDPNKICTVDIKEDDRGKAKGSMNYRVSEGVGKLDLDLNKSDTWHDGDEGEEHFKLKDLETGTWYLHFTDAIPISFNLELGAGKGEFDCSGLRVKNFTLSTGASSVVLRFREPNKSLIENMKIETGLSKFVGESLGNANFRHFQFSGGVGSYTLDFAGELRHEADVKVEVGLGSVTILIPRDIGARVQYEESWMSKVDLDRDFEEKRDGQYISDNYNTAPGRMNISVESGIGHVKIRRVSP